MVDSSSHERSHDAEDAVGNVARSLTSLSHEQILRLISLLLEARNKGREVAEEGHGGQLQSSDQTHEALQRNDCPPVPAAGQKQTVRLWRRLAAFGAGTAGPFVAAGRLVADREVWKNGLANTIPWAIALAAAPIVVPLMFERDRAAAQPKISIEYAVLSQDSQPLPPDIVELITETSKQSIYQSFLIARAMAGHAGQIGSFNVPGARLGAKLRQKFLAETAAFRKYLEQFRSDLELQKAELATLGDAALQRFAFRTLDDPSTLDTTAPRDFLSNALGEKASQASSLLANVDRLEVVITTIPPDVRIRLTLLNKGATDGLVRHEGKLKYRDKIYTIKRTAPPSATALNTLAIPVFQTNLSEDNYAAQSVGKIEQDSMIEFWYAFRRNIDSARGKEQLCSKGEEIEVTLYDHNGSPVRGTLECNLEEI